MKTIGAPADVQEAITNVIIARAKWETVNKIDCETKDEILEKHDFRETDSEERITDCKRDFLMSDVDFKQYCELVYQRNLEKGIDSGGAELTFWPVQKAVYDAENVFIDVVTSKIPQYTPKMIDDVKHDLKIRDKFLKISGL